MCVHLGLTLTLIEHAAKLDVKLLIQLMTLKNPLRWRTFSLSYFEF